MQCVGGRIKLLSKLRSHSQSYNVLRSSACSGIWYSEDRICNRLHTRHYSDNNNNLSKRKERMGKLRTILKEYGAVGVAFHTVISLASLGSCYMVVKSGLDVQKIFVYFNIDSTTDAYKTASTMGVAYILHKLLLPIRAFVTITSVPLIVKYLRAKGIMKTTTPNKQ